MKKLFLILIVFVSISTVNAQNFSDDSLYILFPANSANMWRVSPSLAQQNQEALTNIAQMLLGNPRYRIIIDGHANPVLRTTREEREILDSLSLRRATAVANYLVETHRIDRRRLIIAG